MKTQIKIALLLFLPFIGVGQIIGLGPTIEKENLPNDILLTAIDTFVFKYDTIPCYLLVSDTSMQSKSMTYQIADAFGHYMMYADGTPTATKTDLVYFRDIQPKVIEGYVTECMLINCPVVYLDDKKNPLSKNYIVWQIIEK